MWERIGESVDELSPRGVVEAVVGETRDGQHALRTLLQGVDLTRDAHDLRCVGVVCKFVDVNVWWGVWMSVLCVLCLGQLLWEWWPCI